MADNTITPMTPGRDTRNKRDISSTKMNGTQIRLVEGAPPPGQSYYSLVITTLPISTLEPVANDDNAIYEFKLAPQSITMTEPMAVTIQPTQDGGHYVEHQGQFFKQINIQGTAGFRPNKGKINPSSGFIGNLKDSFTNSLKNANATFNDSISNDEVTGFQEFMQLRNLFRHYSDLKYTSELAGKVAMLFINVKDGEIYVVEPLDFQSDRASNSPFTYRYTISLQTIEFVDPTKLNLDDKLKNFKKASGQSVLRKAQLALVKSSNVINAALSSVNNLGLRKIGIALQALSTISGAISESLALGKDVLNVPQGVMASLARDILNIKNDWDSLKLAGKTFSVRTRAPLAEVSNAFSKINLSMVNLITAAITGQIQLVQAQTAAQKIKEINQAYQTTTTPSNIQTPPIDTDTARVLAEAKSFSQYIIQNNDTLQTIAQKIFDDPNMYKALALINGMTAPYIAEVPKLGLKVPGDAIIYPVNVLSTKGNLVLDTPKEAVSGEPSPIRNQLGTDIALKQTHPSGLVDWAVDTGGDIATIQGIPNLEQAMRLRMRLEMGSLPAHVRYGLITLIGEKNTALNRLKFGLSLQSTLMVDDRVESIEAFDIKSIAPNVSAIRVQVNIKNLGEQLDLTQQIGA